MTLRETHHPWIQEIDWKEATGMQLLESCLPRAKDVERPAFVLDLDSTLFCVEPRTKQIFFDFIRRETKPNELLWKIFRNWSGDVHAYSVMELFELALKKENYSEAKRLSREAWLQFEPYWMANFFRGYYMHYDRPYEGAVEFVTAAHSKGIHILYVTGREYAKAYGGTLRSLKDHGFPVDDSTRLLTKPPQWSELLDYEYKERVCQTLASQYDILCSMDNEPENLFVMAKCFPQAEIVLYHSCMSKRVPRLPIESFMGERALWKIENFV